jgi:predicted transcriptional regulator
MVRLDLQRKERRHKLQIYHDILSAIREESMNEGGAKPTRIQHLSNMSYDKLSRHLDELQAKNMINRGDSLLLTDHGQEFLKEYQRLKDLIERMGLE